LSGLKRLGFGPHFAEQLAEIDLADLRVARVVEDAGRQCWVHDGEQELVVDLAGRLRWEAAEGETRPVAGDWVLVRPAPQGEGGLVVRVLARRTGLYRREVGSIGTRQILAANIDTVVIVQGLDRDFNLRRLERYLVAVHEGGARPVLVLNKADLCADVEGLTAGAVSVAPGVPVHVVSALDGSGLEAVRQYQREGETLALVGSSGVGKSTLLNRLAGLELRRTAEVRVKDGRGRHTTTSRRLVLLEAGGLLLDTPGMRELGLTEELIGLERTFGDIEQLAAGCRFGNCAHVTEPGCAVRAALAGGQLAADRWESYTRLQREGSFQARQADTALERAAQTQTRRIHREHRRAPKKRR
jgi:ribosome biogenesis GTPase